jgi:hypothetical protein
MTPLLRDKHEGDMRVTDERSLRGVNRGTVTASAGGDLGLLGMVIGDLVIEPGVRVMLHGTVTGSVYNGGGVLAVFGTVRGNIITTDGQTGIDSTAQIRGKVSP